MNDTEPSEIRITAIKVTGLFGIYEHLVPLKSDRVTVIHGPNGVGKTVLLKLTNAFLNGRYHEIVRVPFNTLEISFSDRSIARIELFRATPKKKIELTYEYSSGEKELATLEGDVLDTNQLAVQISERSPYISQVGADEFVDRRTDETIDAEQVIARAAEYTPKEAKKLVAREPKGFKELRAKISVHFIEAQRLIRVNAASEEWRYRHPERTSMTATVQEYSRDLKKKLESTLATYAKQSQKLDQTFPQRLLQGSAGPFPINQLKVELADIEATRNRLKKIGLLESSDPTQGAYPLQIEQIDSLAEGQLSVMSVYARDTKEKLSVLDSLSERIELLLGVLNRKFTNKQVTISRESGLAIFGIDSKPIPVTALSSGEQHELVLLYDLLFKVKPNTLVLIDEPELSLHISWQKGFLEDLLEIIKLSKFDALIATHSPYIVGDRSDLLVVLSPELGA